MSVTTPEWQPRFTVEELRAYTDEQIEAMSNGDLINARLVARTAGDKNLAMKIFSKMPLAPESLLAARDTMGADWIINNNLNTTRAVEKYGSNWITEQA